MKIRPREIESFFYTQYFSDSLRTCLGVLMPALVFNFLGKFETGVILSLGALCVSVVDTPGPVVYKRNAMSVACLCIFLTAMATGFARLNVFTLGIGVTILTFLFSMLTVYGTRAAAVGTGSLLMMIFMIEKSSPANQVLGYSIIVTAGGLWYTIFSILFFTIRPYRAAQQALGESIMDIVKVLQIKADFYLPGTDISENYRKLVSQQIQVSQHQDAVRELLFRSRVLVRESTNASRVLVLIFIDLVDLYEKVLATHFDYNEITKKFGDTGVLTDIGNTLNNMAHELEKIGYAILSNRRHSHFHDFIPELERIKAQTDHIAAADTSVSNLALKRILVNLRDLNQNMHNIFTYYNSRSSKALIKKPEDVEYSRFVTRQDYAPQVYFDNFSLSSSSFRHAIRVSLACLVGFVTAKLFVHGHHSYWILLTIIVILKPGFSLSKQRNYQRLTGTIFGGMIGVLILVFVRDKDALFAVFIVMMLATYSFIRINYVVSVIFMTPYVLILFKFLGVGQLTLVEERVIDTVIGSAIAFVSIYAVFPTWEFEQVQKNLADVIHANTCYLARIAETLSGKALSVTDYKLARKDVYVKSANLSAMFERMTSEPKSKQKKVKDIHRFVVLNHILTSYLADVSTLVAEKTAHIASPENIRTIRKAIAVLNESDRKLGGKSIEPAFGSSLSSQTKARISEALLDEQLGFVNKISYDIARVTDDILSPT